LRGIDCIYGRIDRSEDTYEKHNTGVYFQNIPRDPTTNISTIDHRIANDYGFFKIDFLNVHFYEDIRDEAHLLELLNKEPPWDFFQYQELTDKLFHLNGYSHLLTRFKPASVEDLAMILAIIRPAKAHLQTASWEKIRSEVWVKTSVKGEKKEYGFHRAHGISYSLAIIVQLNLMIEQMQKEI
jgi:DNA polymerase III alpha subunit